MVTEKHQVPISAKSPAFTAARTSPSVANVLVHSLLQTGLGAPLGVVLGAWLGFPEGMRLGASLGARLGFSEGSTLGAWLGSSEGSTLGA